MFAEVCCGCGSRGDDEVTGSIAPDWPVVSAPVPVPFLRFRRMEVNFGSGSLATMSLVVIYEVLKAFGLGMLE